MGAERTGSAPEPARLDGPVLATAGYEGLVQPQLIDRLAAAGVAVLIDVRAVPNSRKPGFSKRVLAASLEAAGIRYVHLQALGTPKAGRQAARAGRADEMAVIFEAHMATDPAQAALVAARDIAGAAPACLLCFERDPHFCHRRIVADAIVKQTGQRIVHL
jgi:uncharacterized protein (DUF488 family)